MIYSDILPFRLEIDTVLIASGCLWSLALYLALSNTKIWITEQLERWFNFAERFMYLSEEEFEQTRRAREAQNAFYASVFSIIPFLIIGFIFNWAIYISLGGSWPLSLGILSCIGCGVYELGRINSK